ncbi:MAG: hypothetical protein GJ680_01310 [Alteromonadaceae bacterium]|nr:hypothetical protein [Alteromonadaceae bacterium]
MKQVNLFSVLSFACALIIGAYALADAVQQSKPTIASGVVVPLSANCQPEQLCFPEVPVPLYADVFGKQVGTAKRNNRFDFQTDLSDETYAILTDKIQWSSELNYDANAIEFIDTKEQYFLIAKSSSQALWLRQDTLLENGFRAMLWPEFLSMYSGMVVPLERLNLRTSANTLSDRIGVLDINSDVSFTGRVNGEWAEIKVTLFDKHYCFGEALKKGSHTGWVKYFDKRTETLNFELGGSC